MKIADLFVLSGSHQRSPAPAIAACRAGARGVLDLEYCADLQTARRGIETLERFTDQPYGIKLGVSSGVLVDWLRAHAGRRLQWVIFAGGDHPELAQWVGALRGASRELFLEAVSVPEGERACSLQLDGLILKGQESGGRVGDETAFVLLQHWLRASQERPDRALDLWVQGGIGLHTSAACSVAGVRGVVLSSQLLLARESLLTPEERLWVAALDGSETRLVGGSAGATYRVVSRPGWNLGDELTLREADAQGRAGEGPAAWRQAAQELFARQERPLDLLLLGQDAALARPLAERFVTVGGILQGIVEQTASNVRTARRLQPLAEGAPLAQSHGTRYPLLQGPMTRVSDTAAFAEAVAAAGGLPFLALALLRGKEARGLLEETAQRLKGRAWGAGILGFLPPEIRREQIEAIHATRPPFALIAGGRPDQAQELEQVGIPTYLHVPSPGLLRMFLRDGAQRFVFEGRECGGHVGPRSSFLLWETMIQILLEHTGSSGRGEGLHVVFAGGIHDGPSAAMVAAMAAPLAERGVKIGALMGTAYLFTREAVASGGIVEKFQQEALRAQDTVLFETGPGHAIRCLKTPYFEAFEAEKARLRQQGRTHEEIVRTLEAMNIGRLRVASKGVDRSADSSATRKLVSVSDDDQFQRGMYMVGQVATLRDRVISMAELHDEVCRGGAERLTACDVPALPAPPSESPCDVAIVGMSCFYPGALSVGQYWENVLQRHYAVTEVPATHWDWRVFYDPDPRAKDKIISKWGGFLGDMPFDPFRYGITPKSVKYIEPLQLIVLEGVRQALDDAGYNQRPFNRERTCAVLGIGGGGSPMAVSYGFRACLPMLDSAPGVPIKSEELMRYAEPMLPEWTEDSFPGILMNVAVGRVANRFNFGGSNYAIDAACASSLAAVHCCIRELELGTADVAVAMGADTVQTPYGYMAFSKTHALSARGRCSPFDAAADGIVLSEGVGVVILKRLADAERDGDRIYAVIRGVGSSSDGKEKGLTAPNAAGQLRAIRRAYAKARISPARAGLIEAHGTGTVVGDRTEAQALSQVMREAGAELQSCALGSVKSMIGHSKCAAGVAGLIKTTLALHHRVLPPTLVETPNPTANFPQTALYLNTEPRPWVHGGDEPRVAGVSAFGFGGTNGHVVLEEYTRDYLRPAPPAQQHWPAELFAWRRETPQKLAEALRFCEESLAGGARPELEQFAASVWKSNPADPRLPTLAIVATSLEDLREKLATARSALATHDRLHDPRGIYYARQPAEHGGQVAMLFPGQGSQYPNMLAQVAMNFADARAALDRADGALRGLLERPLARFIYPPSAFSPADEQETRTQLARADVAQPALGAASLALLAVLRRLGVQADCVAGHSYGEYVALCAGGAIPEADLIRLSHVRGRLLRDSVRGTSGGMAALEADHATVTRIAADVPGITIANQNSPQQTVISGTDEALAAALPRFLAAGIRGQRLPVSCAFHSPLVADAAAPLAAELRSTSFRPLARPVYSNLTALPYPDEPAAVVEQLSQHLVSPVRFQAQIEAMYAAGVRIFIEVGPAAVLTGLVSRILTDRPHLAVATDQKGRPGLVQLAHVVGQLLAHGVDVRAEQLFLIREVPGFELGKLPLQTGTEVLSPSTWIVNGVRSRPLKGPEPQLLGQTGKASAASAAPPAAASSPAPATPRPPEKGSAPSPPVVSAALATRNPEQPLARSTRVFSAASQEVSKAAPPPVSPAPRTPLSTAQKRALPMKPVSEPVAEPHLQNGHSPASGETRGGAEPLAGDEAAQVMLGFQNLMAKFLETQRAVMLSYLAPGSLPAAPGGTAEVAGASVYSSSAAVTEGNGHPLSKVMEPRATVPPAVAAEVPPAPPPAIPAANPALPPAAVRKEDHPSTTPGGSPVTHSAGTQGDSPAPPEAPLAPRATLAQISAQLLDLVSERTGYPQEMLDVDLDLEADLGIDSIKRVEILGTLAESIGGSQGDLPAPQLELEKLTTLRNLRSILGYLEDTLFRNGEASHGEPRNGKAGHGEAAAAPAADSEPRPGQAASSTGYFEVQRARVRLVSAPLPANGTPRIPSGAVLLTDDGRGIAREIADRLADFGQTTVLLQMADSVATAAEDEDKFAADLTDPEAVKHVVTRIRGTVGPIAGLIHTLPLAAEPDQRAWAPRAERDVRSLYLLARELEADICRAAQEGHAFVLAGTGLGGGLGFDGELPSPLQPGHGGVLGFIKCLGMEWSEVLVRGVDCDPARPARELAERLLAELGDADGPLEVGYLAGERVTWEPFAAPLATDTEAPPPLNTDSTVLITGGGRGITAEIAVELARRYQPTLVLVGRSPLPADEEAGTTRHLAAPADIKAALIADVRQQGRSAAPAEVEAQYARLMRDREIRANLARIREAGSQVHYFSLDVRDAAAMAGLVQQLKERFGGLDGVIHGAGVIEDKLIRDKTPGSFDRVFGTKAESAMHLSQLLDFERLKFCAFFASIASRYGNRGQADYAAANEVLSKLALALDRRSGGRVFSVAWGPWAEVGMVSDLAKHLTARGVTLIAPDVGARLFADELHFGRKGDGEILIAGGAENVVQPKRSREPAAVS